MSIKKIPDELREVFWYNEMSGELVLKVRAGNYAKGTIVGGYTSDRRYLKTTYKGKIYLVHRIVWFLHYGEQPPDVIDHINGDGTCNLISNLRAACSSTNQMNIDATNKSTTGIKGIFPIRGGKLFRAEVCVGGMRYQKHSVDPNTLVAWLEETRNKHHGEFANH